RGKLMVEQFSELLRKYPNSEFADDALAELGVYKLLWGYGKKNEARELFRQVITNYPKGNAVDNSYNWIAWSRKASFGYLSMTYSRIFSCFS
ncbi:unnamed protein product, partial [marine sediment metagenome]